MDSKVDIQKLLQLKRYEAPPSGFHENFLNEFQRRQRADLLRRTLRPSIRETLRDRVSYSLSSGWYVPSLGYALITAVGVLVSAAIWLHSPEDITSSSLSTASTSPKENINFSLTSPVEIPKQRPVGTLPPGTLPPYYILENRPASYEVPLGF